MSSSSDEDSGSDDFSLPSAQPGQALDWTCEEQANLDQALLLHPAERFPTAVERYIVVAAQVPTRTSRDVALRISWLTSQQNLQRAQPADPKRRTALPSAVVQPVGPPVAPSKIGLRSSARASSVKKEATGTQPPIFSTESSYQPGSLPPPLAVPLLPSLSASCLYQSSSPPTNSNSSDDACIDIIGAVAAATGMQQRGGGALSSSSEEPPLLEVVAMHGGSASTDSGSMEPSLLSAVQLLMEQNYAILNNFKANMEQCRVVENTELLVRLRDNVMSCLGHMGSMGGPVSSMPPLPVQLNLELANKFLPPKIIMGHPMAGLPPFSFNPSLGHPLMMPPAPPPGLLPLPPHMMMMPPPPPPELPIPAGMVPSTSPRSFIVPAGMVPQQSVPLMRPNSGEVQPQPSIKLEQ